MQQLFIWVSLLILLSLFPAYAAERRTFTISEPFGLAWGPDRVNYPVDISAGTGVARGGRAGG